MNLIKTIKNNKAFSLLEVTLAMGVLVIGIIGVFSLVIQNAQVQTVNKNYLVASMLAQEGIELVRGRRDSNWLDASHLDWYAGIADGDDTFTADFYSLGTFNFSPNSITDNGARLYLESGTNLYTHTGGGNTPTQYYRLIEISNFIDHDGDGKGDSFQVSSQVQWTAQGKTYHYTAETLLYNWRGF